MYPSNDEGIEEAKKRILNQANEQSREVPTWQDSDIYTPETSDQIIPENQDEEIIWINEDSLLLEASPSFELELPSFVDYWDAVATSERSFVYNQVRWLEIFVENIEQELTCDDLTEFLSSRIANWYFWNTCRTISWEEGLKFNVLRLNGIEYVYERHYIDTSIWIYWILELERGEGIDKDMLPEKNTEFRDREFPLIEITDGLMREIIRIN